MLISIEHHKQLVLWASKCAERVLANFESERPGDSRPRQALEAGRAWVQGGIPMQQARTAAFAAHAAARAANSRSARAAARAAGHAAATAHVPSHARYAAAYAVSSVKATVADSGKADVRAAEEKRWQAESLGKLELSSEAAAALRLLSSTIR